MKNIRSIISILLAAAITLTGCAAPAPQAAPEPVTEDEVQPSPTPSEPVIINSESLSGGRQQDEAEDAQDTAITEPQTQEPVFRSGTVDLMADFANAAGAEGAPEMTGGESWEFAAEFALDLLKGCISGENTVISPISVLAALAMTANGARGETLYEMQAALGLPVDELNRYMAAYMAALSGDGGTLHMANSIWFNDGMIEPVDAFLETNAAYYGAGLFKSRFGEHTADDINGWIEHNTNGRISDMISDVPSNAVMYLVNALSFDAEWASVYYEDQVRTGEFTREDGTVEPAEFMCSEESIYIEDELAAGFIKPYEGNRYAFAALLPNEGVSVEEYAASLTGEGLLNMLENAARTGVSAQLPKFESAYGTDLVQTLKDMGMADAFDYSEADFTGLAENSRGKIAIDKVLHKAFISVHEKGTEAGAATVVEMLARSTGPREMKEVHLDRPFVYMLIDTEANLPIFMGTVMQLGE